MSKHSTRGPRILRRSDLSQILTLPEALQTIRDTYIAHSHGRVSQPDPMLMTFPSVRGEAHIKAAHIREAGTFTVKVATGFPDNRWATSNGALLVLDAGTGEVLAVILDEGYITRLRTAAAAAVAADALANPDIDTIGLIGAGAQAPLQIMALMEVRSPRQVLVWNRHPAKAHTVAEWATERFPGTVIAVDDLTPEIVVRRSQLLITQTAAPAPLVVDQWVQPGTHISAVGADAPGKNELDPQLLTRASLFVDDLAQCVEYGEVSTALHAGLLADQQAICVLGAVLAGDRPARISASEVTVCDLTGVGALDAAIAAQCLALAEESSTGLDPSRFH